MDFRVRESSKPEIKYAHITIDFLMKFLNLCLIKKNFFFLIKKQTSLLVFTMCEVHIVCELSSHTIKVT